MGQTIILMEEQECDMTNGSIILSSLCKENRSNIWSIGKWTPYLIARGKMPPLRYYKRFISMAKVIEPEVNVLSFE